MNSKVINNHVLFQFIDEVHQGQFCDEKIGSIIIANKGKDHTKDSTLDRVAKVIDVGPDCKFVNKHDTVIVQCLRWTPGFKTQIEGNIVEVWRTTEEFIQAIIEET